VCGRRGEVRDRPDDGCWEVAVVVVKGGWTAAGVSERSWNRSRVRGSRSWYGCCCGWTVPVPVPGAEEEEVEASMEAGNDEGGDIGRSAPA
jgi:hypothetical protein